MKVFNGISKPVEIYIKRNHWFATGGFLMLSTQNRL